MSKIMRQLEAEARAAREAKSAPPPVFSQNSTECPVERPVECPVEWESGSNLIIADAYGCIPGKVYVATPGKVTPADPLGIMGDNW